ncbi:MAG: 3-hydroxyacyl-CoA dehydrogenase/enoyl-CoA hydratase family protein [Balneolaceae bacterium]
MRPTRFQKVVILGAGVMGSQIAAHCLNAGMEVWLLDLKSEDAERPNRIAEEAVSRLKTMKPAPLADPEHASRIHTGNFQDDLSVAEGADWVCEVVIERMDVKQEMMARLESVRGPTTVVSSNTSGLPIKEIVAGCSEAFRSYFLGTHFFNPPRYMKLLELIPTPDTDPDVLKAMERFCEVRLGKGVVRCKDTPNFIGNRIGVFSIASVMPWYVDGRMSAEEIDLLTGPISGYSKAATFRTCDIVGLDVLQHVASNLYPSIPDDERRELFRLPALFEKMVENGWLGNKSGQGFYKKVSGPDGKEYRVLNPETLEYGKQSDPEFESVEHARENFSTPEERLKYIAWSDDRAGRFLWETQCDLLLYAANRIPEISDSVESIDRAMEWGYNWELGPFRRWDAIGVRESVERMQQEGREVPGPVLNMLDNGRNSFYQNGTVYNLATGKAEPLSPPAADAVTTAGLRSKQNEVWRGKESALIDMGSGVALFEFQSRQNTLSMRLMEELQSAGEKVPSSFDALVIGHDGENFSYGADLSEVLRAVQKGSWNFLERAIRNFQAAVLGLRYHPFPVVSAVSGRVFGGGVELVMHSDRVIAHHELYCGLVEFGVGLIPAGGGTKEMLLRSMNGLTNNADPLPFLKEAFTTIGMAKVSASALQARKLGFLRREDSIVMNRDLILREAHREARLLADRGYHPPARPKIRVTGQTGYSALRVMLYNLQEAGQISPYDALLGERAAWVLSGGNVSEPQEVPEKTVLELEVKAIMELLHEEKTLKRIEQMLKSGKPLRN